MCTLRTYPGSSDHSFPLFLAYLNMELPMLEGALIFYIDMGGAQAELPEEYSHGDGYLNCHQSRLQTGTITALDNSEI